MGLTTTGVALIAACVAAAGAIATFVGSWVINKRTLATQRDLNHDSLTAQRRQASDQRLWEKKSSLYVDCLNTLYKTNRLMGTMNPWDDDAVRAAIADVQSHRIEIRVFAHETVSTMYSNYTSGLQELASNVRTFDAMDLPEDPGPYGGKKRSERQLELGFQNEDVAMQVAAIERAIRKDLQGEEPDPAPPRVQYPRL